MRFIFEARPLGLLGPVIEAVRPFRARPKIICLSALNFSDVVTDKRTVSQVPIGVGPLDYGVSTRSRVYEVPSFRIAHAFSCRSASLQLGLQLIASTCFPYDAFHHRNFGNHALSCLHQQVQVLPWG